jgi:glyoxylase-like metal-dependent hydrolase (beta-lactamase superfamily II)
VGGFTLSVLPDTPFRLDGGAMFGVVPKVLWERHKPADAQNRIQMTTNCLLIGSPRGEVVLVDAGIGEKLDPRGEQQFAVPAGEPRLLDRMAAAGVAPERVDHVVLTHLHFDHCGWSTRRDQDRRDQDRRDQDRRDQDRRDQDRHDPDRPAERWVPTFPNARYWIQRDELEHARHPNERDRPSYDPRNFEPLLEAGVVELFGEEAKPVAGVRATRAPGHTPGMAVVTVEDAGEGAIFFADLVPTAAHLPTPWVMGYDLYPVTTMEHKPRWVARAAEAGWLCVFEHDPEVPVARLVPGDRPGRWRAAPVGLGDHP